ncbi:MAG: hypothetical protein WCI05_12170 [Myxococcales bacterium]
MPRGFVADALRTSLDHAFRELIASWPVIVEESVKAGVKGTQLELL